MERYFDSIPRHQSATQNAHSNAVCNWNRYRTGAIGQGLVNDTVYVRGMGTRTDRGRVDGKLGRINGVGAGEDGRPCRVGRAWCSLAYAVLLGCCSYCCNGFGSLLAVGAPQYVRPYRVMPKVALVQHGPLRTVSSLHRGIEHFACYQILFVSRALLEKIRDFLAVLFQVQDEITPQYV